MGVSKNKGTPKSFILIGFSIINHSFWDTPIFGNTHIALEYEFGNAGWLSMPINFRICRWVLPLTNRVLWRTSTISIHEQFSPENVPNKLNMADICVNNQPHHFCFPNWIENLLPQQSTPSFLFSKLKIFCQFRQHGDVSPKWCREVRGTKNVPGQRGRAPLLPQTLRQAEPRKTAKPTVSRVEYTLPETNSSPLKLGWAPKGNESSSNFQPLIFRPLSLC